MEAQRILNANLDDLVFEGRNRAYGAYLLRQLYSKHILQAAAIGTAIFVLAFLAPSILSLFKSEKAVTEAPQATITEFSEPPSLTEELEPPPPADMPPPAKTVVFTPPVIVEDEQVDPEEAAPTLEELDNVDPNATNVDPNANYDFNAAGNNPVVNDAPSDEPRKWAEQMPQFPGGEQELQNFLRKNLKYPIQARENHIEGKVIIQFVVDEAGGISNIQVMREIGGGTTEESLRVLKMMPAWNPGRQNGRPVKVYCIQTFKFQLDAE